VVFPDSPLPLIAPKNWKSGKTNAAFGHAVMCWFATDEIRIEFGG